VVTVKSNGLILKEQPETIFIINEERIQKTASQFQKNSKKIKLKRNN
jgi:hypothetical protein